ncbi:MAG: RNA-binding transcriptional accessory protein [Gemmatimonadaceae bacterium]|nr:RNA-binding transcriptional accessory protein [Gemmatimonadaceae bacterium]
MVSQTLISTVARELSLAPQQVAGALALFDEGNTLPFIARYRKEATGGLDEVQLREVRDRAQYLRELEERRAAIIKSIEEQGKLTPELQAQLARAETKQALEDLYLPFKPKRRTRALIARERGLEPLAGLLWAGAHDEAALEREAAAYVNAEKEVPDVAHALAGARDILAERIAENAELRGRIRDVMRREGRVRSRAITGKENEVSKFQDYYDFAQPLAEIPSHRMLAIRRGETEGFLVWNIEAPAERIVGELEQEYAARHAVPAQMRLVVQDAYKRLIAPAVEIDLRVELKTRADEEAIAIFGRNLEQLLLAPPAGERVVIGLDPGFRTGVKVAAVSRTGAVVATDTIFLHQPDRFAATLLALIARLDAELIAIGNGTASRETEALVRDTLRERGLDRPQVVVVNEAGASVYSASDVARTELPDLDVSLRGAVSIARRLQDPLAELVKIDPKSIGVGQYQHDVSQPRLKQRLDEVVESCVNRVGVEVNTASVQLLSYVAGIGPALAANIVKWRDERGGVRARGELMEVPRLGAKAFEQAAGFLRVRGGAHPLDASAVHPERYPLVERMAADLGVPLAELIGNDALLKRIEPDRYVGDGVGRPTLDDILAELRKPGRDPRSAFEPPAFRDDVREPKDLKEGMELDGVVTNIVAFGAFVDIGVHQDGLVHVSQLADRYVADPNTVVRVGQKVRVRVLSVDLERNRIALSMKSGNPGKPGQPAPRQRATRPAGRPASQSAPRTFKPGEIAPNGMRFK